MMGAFRAGLDQFLGRGSASVTVPPMDGALKPNSLLDDAIAVAEIAEPDNLVFHNGTPVFSSGTQVHRLEQQTGRSAVIHQADGVVTALAVSPGQALAVAADGGSVVILGGAHNGRSFAKLGNQELTCVTALAFAEERVLLVCLGSSEHPIAAWQRDLLTHGRSGSVWRLDLATGEATKLAGNLCFPNGILMQPGQQGIVVSESWRQRLIRLQPQGGKIEQLMEDLPGYPARLSPSGRGGAWLSVFAPRSQLIEFVLRERVYRNAMMAEVAPEYWIAPALRSNVSFKEPMQGGALKQMGILKPWAPTRSYGLVIELDGRFEAIRSLHSRAAGRRHGITTAMEANGELWMTSKGGDEVLKMALSGRGA
jgi:hypothetical protein